MPALGACELPLRSASTGAAPRAALPPVLERMRRTYDDLESGRFLSVADFETPGQELMFRVAAGDDREAKASQPTLSILRARNETGAAGLKAVLTDAAAQLIFDGQRSTQMALVRNWSTYSLFLMSIYGPPEGVVLEFGVTSGGQSPANWVQTLAARPGWNLVRIDLDSVGDHVDLADVRALTWRAPQSTGPVEIYLDDLILADNTRTLLGEETASGALYVRTRGRRIEVGAQGRFGLALANGQIVRWRGETDANLADIDGLGPWPVPLPANWLDENSAPVAYDDAEHYSKWGVNVAATQRIVEATPFRVVIEAAWRFEAAGADSSTAPADMVAVGHIWRYVIYPSGAVYVRVQSKPSPAGWPEALVGHAVGLDARRGFVRARPAAAEEAVGGVLLSRTGSQQADLLWAWAHEAPPGAVREFVSADERRLAVVAGGMAAAGAVDSAHLLRLWPPDLDAWPAGEGLVADYRTPARLTVSSGWLVTDAPGDLNHDGFNESEGCYELAAIGGVARFVFEPGGAARFEPTIRVADTAGRRCWVYAQGRLVLALGRDARENLLFQLPRVVSAAMVVEVHSAPEDAGG